MFRFNRRRASVVSAAALSAFALQAVAATPAQAGDIVYYLGQLTNGSPKDDSTNRWITSNTARVLPDGVQGLVCVYVNDAFGAQVRPAACSNDLAQDSGYCGCTPRRAVVRAGSNTIIVDARARVYFN